jgi:hypothetical protein
LQSSSHRVFAQPAKGSTAPLFKVPESPAQRRWRAWFPANVKNVENEGSLHEKGNGDFGDGCRHWRTAMITPAQAHWRHYW